MKKQSRNKKQLKFQTIRNLTPVSLQAAVGGAGPIAKPSPPPTCGHTDPAN